MKRGLFVCVIALMAGVYTAYLAPDFIPVTLLFMAAWILFVSLFFTKRGRLPFFMILFFLLGAVHMQSCNDITKRPLYPYIDEYVTMTADVIREPVYNEEDGSSTLMVRVQQLSFLGAEAEPGEVVYLKIKKNDPVPQFGQRFTAVCLFYVPDDAMNRGGFDYALYLKSKDIFFRGRAESGTVAVTGEFPLSLSDKIYRLNRRCGQVLAEVFPPDAAAVLQAMVLGDTDAISDSLQTALQVSGLSHMISVSGMHVSILVSALYMLLSLLGWSRHRFGWLVGGFLLFFIFFTGASPAVVRAGVMGLLMVLAQLIYRKEDPLTSLAVAAGVIVAINPLTAFDAGFMLSFAATLGIFVVAEPLGRRLSVWLGDFEQQNWGMRVVSGLVSYCTISVGAQLFLLPVASWVFGYTSLWAFVSGLLAMPLGSVMLIVGLLTSVFGLVHPMAATLLSGFVYPFVFLFLQIVYFFGRLQSGLFIMGSFSAFGLYIFVLFLLAADRLLRRRWRQSVAVALSLLILLTTFFVSSGRKEETAQITFINVGQGDCTLLELPRGVDILIDGGGTPAYRGDFDVGGQIVLPYLRKAGIRQLDYMVASHPHDDHIRGLASLLEMMPVKTLLVPVGFGDIEAGADFLKKAAAKQVTVRELTAGDELSFSEDCSLEVLMPEAGWPETAEEENDRSLALRLRFGDNTALFTGDLETEGEEQLVAAAAADSGARIIKVGHHGSANSATEALLSWARPWYAYIPCGENSFGHPAPDTLDRLAAHGVTVFRADEDKDVRFVLSKTGIRLIRKGGVNHDEN